MCGGQRSQSSCRSLTIMDSIWAMVKIEAFDATIGLGVVGSRMEFGCTKKFVYGLRKVGRELRTVIRKEACGAAPARDVVIHKNVGSSSGREVGSGNGVKCDISAEAITVCQHV